MTDFSGHAHDVDDAHPPASTVNLFSKTMVEPQAGRPGSGACHELHPVTVFVRREDRELAIPTQRIHQLGPIVLTEGRPIRAKVSRLRSDIARMQIDGVAMIRTVGHSFTWDYRSRNDMRFESGDMAFLNGDECFSSHQNGQGHFRHWFMPFSRLAPAVVDRLSEGLHFCKQDPRTAMVGAYADELQRRAADMSPELLDVFADNLCRLVTIVATGARPEAVEGGERAVRSVRLVRVHNEIEPRLTNPLLSPVMIAACCGISVRTLHSLFEPEEETFSQYVIRRRLEMARSMLGDPRFALRSVTDIAYSTGFSSLSSFYARYRERFGHAPGDARQGATNRRAT